MIIAEIFKPGKDIARFRAFAKALRECFGRLPGRAHAIVDNALIN